MIVSHRNKFIFIKTRKTAGTSIEVFLEKLCGDDDIVTKINPPVEGHHPRNFAGFYNHMSAAAVRERIGSEVFSQYYKFCFERNPYEKVVSAYRWQKKQGNVADSFGVYCTKCFINYIIDVLRLPSRLKLNAKACFFPIDWNNYSEDGNQLVDFVGSFEKLEDDLYRALDAIGLQIATSLTKQKSTSSDVGNQESGRDMYNFWTRIMVRVAFRNEILRFGYRPDG